jgi:hypothetical protein
MLKRVVYTITTVGFQVLTKVVMALLAARIHADFLLGLFFHPEDEGDMLLRNVC